MYQLSSCFPQGESTVNLSFPLEGLSFAFADYFCFISGHENVCKGHCGLAPHHSSVSLEVVPPIKLNGVLLEYQFIKPQAAQAKCVSLIKHM